MEKPLIFFGHLGLTAGAAKLCETAAAKKRNVKPPDIDYRLVLVGSLLPDLLDKPIGALLFINTFHNSRIFAHTLLFSLILLIAGVVLYRRRQKKAVLTLGLASMFHVLLDGMWRYAETLLWPLMNIKPALAAETDWLGVLLSFPYRFNNWLEGGFSDLLKNPAMLVCEAAGFAILAVFFIRLLRRHQLKEFLKTGKL